MSELARDLTRERILAGLCPQCGGEAAPYRLCWDCRSKRRFIHCLKRMNKEGTVERVGEGRNSLWQLGRIEFDPKKHNRWATPFVLPESDGRGKPRLRGIRIDVERTLLEIVKFINRPCSTEEIMAAWGKLRDRRTSPLPHDLGRILKAQDRRQRKLANNLRISRII